MREQSPGNSSALGGITSGWEGIAALDGTFRYGFESCDMTLFFFLFLLIFFIHNVQYDVRQRLKCKFKYVPP